ncbi:hypothetical protein J2Z31_001190 [Sinorhizobium kostiense]|uniref:Transmembrane protein n=1 Tax=Sinorhizobium kostiense TaxID=76747 RepID=A0ABS4QVN5_9HYPH|nr:hypothetical protein [Sinorhizobium kostiense]MBP2234700.1 hypothetical protein [Sinorhizobium kostiense]
MARRPDPNPAQIRGDVQHGRTGDKTRGFDPAAAPLETDAEAAGTPLTGEVTRNARAGQLRKKPADISTEYADALRPLSDTERISPIRQWLWLALPIAALAIMLGILVYVAIGGSP